MDEMKNEPLTHLLKLIVKEAVREVLCEIQPSQTAEGKARQLAEINAKPYITVPEAQLLLGCSDSLLYKHIKDARSGKAKRPIPYRDIGVYIFPRELLLCWVDGEDVVSIKITEDDKQRAA
jgi:predicted DNA-binding transcriptional regulator AlpA